MSPRKVSAKPSAKQKDPKKNKEAKKEINNRKKKPVIKNEKPRVIGVAKLGKPANTKKHNSSGDSNCSSVKSPPKLMRTSTVTPTRPVASIDFNLISPTPTDGMSTVTSIISKPLASFGIKSAKPTPAQIKSAPLNGSSLRCVVVSGAGLQKPAIVFRFQANDPNSNGSWAEKCMNDAIKDREEWVQQLEFDSGVLQWYDGNVAMKNMRNFPVRLFVIYTENMPSKKDILIELGQHICNQINRRPENKTTSSVDPNSYFWIEDTVVWSDIIGCQAALQWLYRLAGQPFAGK